MARSIGHADLPLHIGTVPKWLADRMKSLGTLIIESLIQNYGKKEVLVRLSDPFWFQSFGAVLGMDWHSSGITTSVMYALKRGINENARKFGLCVCGGRGKYSRKTPEELTFLANATGLDGDSLINASKLCAKVDNSAVQDGFQLYQHNFVVTNQGDWAVIQQGMNPSTKTARRYHWCSDNLRSFVEEPHKAVIGENQGEILNLTAIEANSTRKSILALSKEEPTRLMKEITLIKEKDGLNFSSTIEKNLVLPFHHDVRAEDVDLKRLGAVLVTAYESSCDNFEELLLTKGLGPRTLQSLTLVSEIIHGTPSRFTDPARFSFAHGGKDGHPFPVPLKVYDKSIEILHNSIEKAHLGYNEKSFCIKRLHDVALEIENNFNPLTDFDKTIAHERKYSQEWGGKTVSC